MSYKYPHRILEEKELLIAGDVYTCDCTGDNINPINNSDIGSSPKKIQDDANKNSISRRHNMVFMRATKKFPDFV
jgi:hypothetical protein